MIIRNDKPIADLKIKLKSTKRWQIFTLFVFTGFKLGLLVYGYAAIKQIDVASELEHQMLPLFIYL